MCGREAVRPVELQMTDQTRVCNRLSGYSGYSDILKNLSVRIAT